MVSEFKGKYYFLSNFYPCGINFEGDTYPSVENAFQAAKVLDKHKRISFLCCSASEAKKIGRRVSLRYDWNNVRLAVMKECLLSKFSDPGLKRMLLETGEKELVEGNNWGDRFWGVCRGQGQNHLGKLLMEVRKELSNK